MSIECRFQCYEIRSVTLCLATKMVEELFTNRYSQFFTGLSFLRCFSTSSTYRSGSLFSVKVPEGSSTTLETPQGYFYKTQGVIITGCTVCCKQ